MSSKPSGWSGRKGRGRQKLSPDEECIDLHLNHGLELRRAYDLTNPKQTYQAIWERANRIKKAAAAAANAASKSPKPTAISTTNLSPMSDLTSSTTPSASTKKGAGKSVAEVTKKAKRDEVIERSLKSLPSYVDGEKIKSTMTKRPKRSLQQVNRDNYLANAEKKHYDERYKEQFKKATLEYEHNVKNNLAGKRGFGLRAVEAKYNALLDSPNDKTLKRGVIQKYVNEGKAGKSPTKTGRPPKIPPEVTKGLAQHSTMRQLGQEGEATAKSMEILATALMIGTEHEGKFNAAYAVRKARKEHPDIMQPSSAVGSEDRRAEWLTHQNINRHTDLVQKFLVDDVKFVIDEPGKILGEDSEITLHHHEDIRRFINLDETHHTISTASDKGGSRTTRWTNSSFPRSGDRVLESSSHTTGLYMTNPVEALPPVYIFETGAKDPDNARMDPRWCMDLPTVTGIWGLEKPTTKSSYVCSRRKGSMEKGLWMTVLEDVIKPLYPNMQREVVRDPVTKKLLKGPVFVKTDAGAGRLAQEAECAEFRERMAAQGLYIILGLPNGTSATQEMDQCYSEYQPACKRSTIRLASIKLKERVDARLKSAEEEETEVDMEADLDAFLTEEGHVDLLDDDEDTIQIKVKDSVCNVKLNNCDLPFVVNGLPNDPVENKPFDNTFTPTKIWSWWVAVGFIPMNRNSLKHDKVRVMLGEGGAPPETLEKMEVLVKDYTANALELRRLGYNGQVFDATIPVAKTEEQILEEDEQVDKLIDEKRLGSAGGMFKAGIVVANCDVVVKAAAKKKAMEEEKQKKKLQEKELKDQNSESSAIYIYSAWKNEGKKMKKGTPDITAPNLKAIFDFLVPKIDPTVKLSEYGNKQKRWERLLEFEGRGTTWEVEMDKQIEAAGARHREAAGSPLF